MVIDPSGAVRRKRAEGDAGTGLPLDRGLFTDFPELQGISPEKVAFEEIFASSKRGGYRNRKNKFKIKILMAVSEVMDKIVRDGERVMRIGKGTAYYPAELFFGITQTFMTPLRGAR